MIFVFFDVTLIQVLPVHNFTYRGYTVRITPFVLTIVFKKALLHCETYIAAIKLQKKMQSCIKPLHNRQTAVSCSNTNTGAWAYLQEIKLQLLKMIQKREVCILLSSSSDFNPLDYYFWDKVKGKVFSGHHARPFQSEKELQDRICFVWDQCTENFELLRIKTMFG